MHASWMKKLLTSVFISVFVLVEPVMSEASPWPMTFSSTFSAGPDGPWNALNLSVDYPDQYLAMMPSLTQTSVIINSTACIAQDANCPVPTPNMWTGSGAQTESSGSRDSGELSPSAWEDDAGIYTTQLLGLEGSCRYLANRFTLQKDGGIAFLDNQVMTVADNFTVTFPGSEKYTMDVGMFSLYGKNDEFSWNNYNDSVETNNLTLPLAYIQSDIPSISYGLHMGSVSQNIDGSLYLGGYDSSRVLTDPITAGSDDYVYLADISLGVTEGGYGYLNTSSTSITGLLKANSSTSVPLSAQPDPGVPYLYLPGETCDAIANHLPVYYSSDFNLYLWNTTATEYKSIISSPHYLAFSFHTSGQTGATSDINLPFALLNLTLESPLVSESTQYFPCYAYTPQSSSLPTTILGRAFLQGAFLAQNWQSQYMWLAQAPGPSFESANAKTIETDSETLAAMTNAPLWNATWSEVLTPLSSNDTSTAAAASGAASSSSSGTYSDSSSGLSSGAKAGIGAGVGVGGAALLAGLAGWFWWRKRRATSSSSAPAAQRQTSQTGSGMFPQTAVYGQSGMGRQPYYPVHEGHEVHEAADAHVEEMPAGERVLPKPWPSVVPAAQVPQEMPADEHGGLR